MAEPTHIPEFTTKKKGPADGEDATPEQRQSSPPVYTFMLDGVQMQARKPKDALIAELGPIGSRRTPPIVKVKLSLDFLDDCLLEPGRTHLRDRLLDPDDDLDAEDCMPILEAIGDYWKDHVKKNRR